MAGRKKCSVAHMWTEEEKKYLSRITPGKHHKEILELMNKKFEYQFSLNQIKGAIKRYGLNTGFTGRFEKGQQSWNKGTKGICKSNKTSFKKGNTPKNHKPVGSERTNVDGYVEVKVKEPNTWRLKHQVIWEQEHGEKPFGSVIIFADSDKTNLNIDNLQLVTRQQLLVMNKNGLIKSRKELTETGINIANLIIKMNDIKNNK